MQIWLGKQYLDQKDRPDMEPADRAAASDEASAMDKSIPEPHESSTANENTETEDSG
jgi:hypothetical protein